MFDRYKWHRLSFMTGAHIGEMKLTEAHLTHRQSGEHIGFDCIWLIQLMGMDVPASVSPLLAVAAIKETPAIARKLLKNHWETPRRWSREWSTVVDHPPKETRFFNHVNMLKRSSPCRRISWQDGELPSIAVCRPKMARISFSFPSSSSFSSFSFSVVLLNRSDWLTGVNFIISCPCLQFGSCPSARSSFASYRLKGSSVAYLTVEMELCDLFIDSYNKRKKERKKERKKIERESEKEKEKKRNWGEIFLRNKQRNREKREGKNER